MRLFLSAIVLTYLFKVIADVVIFNFFTKRIIWL